MKYQKKSDTVVFRGKKPFYLILYSIFFFLIIMSFADSLGDISVLKKGWNVVYSTDTDYFVHFEDRNSKVSQICLLSKIATNQGQLPNDRALVDKTSSQISILHPQMKRISGINYFGYCYTNINRNYLKFGEHSTVVEYQEESKIEYTFETHTLNITLLKNSSEGFSIFPEDIFVFYDNEGYKFGANDSANLDREVYKYLISSTEDLYYFDNLNQLRIYNINENEVHVIDFSDICFNSLISCSYNLIDNNNLEIVFDSGNLIDPFIQVSPLSSDSLSMTSLSPQKIILSKIYNGNASYSVYYTNGSFITEQSVITGLGAGSRAKVKARNSTEFVFYYFDTTTGNGSFVLYNDNFNNLTGRINHEQYGGSAIDFSLMFRDPYRTENSLYIGYADDLDNDLNLDIMNFTNSTISSYVLDAGITAEDTLSNLISCEFVNSTLIACSYFDDADDDITLVLFDVPTKTNSFTVDIDATAGSLGRVSNVVSNSIIATLYYDSVDQDITVEFRHGNGTVKTASIDIDTTAGTSSSLSSTSTFSSLYNQDTFVLVWKDSIDSNIKAGVYLSNGTELYQYNLSSNINPTYPLFNVYSSNSYLGYGMDNGTYAFLYVNSTGSTLLNFYYLNGSEFRSILVSDINGISYNNLLPLNNTFTNNTIINFSLNASDDVGLSNGTIYIYNESNDLINITTRNLSGTNNIFSVVYNFVTDGVYTWFVRIYDLAGNFLDTVVNTITIDNSYPVMSYVSPTLPDLSSIPSDNIEVNVTSLDSNLSYIRIDFYKGNVFNMTINSTSSNLYYNFQNLLDLTTYRFNSTSCDVNGLCSVLPTRSITLNSSLTSDINFQVQVEQYPYLDLNVSYTINALLESFGNPIVDSNITILISNGTDSNLYQMVYNLLTETYQVGLTFVEGGTYNFIVFSNHTLYGNEMIEGTFYVFDPFYITFGFYERKKCLLCLDSLYSYRNDFAYLIAEPKQDKYYDDNLENFIFPLDFNSRYNIPVFHAKYINGNATLKLFDPDIQYAIRLIDGEITFLSSYSVPNMTKSYGTNFYVDLFTFNGTDSSYNILITKKDYEQYKWLFNWLLIIGVFMSGVVAVILLFLVPTIPALSIIFFSVISCSLIIIRIIIWLYFGW